MKRRHFLRTVGAGAVGGLFQPSWLVGAEKPYADILRNHRPYGPLNSTEPSANPDDVHLVVLHTSDTHSRIDPFPMNGGRFEGMGGVARRSTLVRRIREENPNVLLFDSGDIFQGTPYFNFFDGEIEFRAMSEVGYDVATLGNHDFDIGVDGLVNVLPHADFQFVSANYDVTNSALAPHVKPWTIRDFGDVRIGIFGLGPGLQGLVLDSLHEGVVHTDSFAAARQCVAELRDEGCSLIICLSHMGYSYRPGQPSDTLLAQEVEGIDMILGGHTHRFMDQPDIYDDSHGRRTLVNHAGWGGIRVGRIDVVIGTEPGVSSSIPSPCTFNTVQYPIDGRLD